jgi:hypothetical protein
VIDLSYNLSPAWKESAASTDWSRVDETTLRYKAFLGDQIFVVNGADFSARWGWVPILDFAACLVAIIKGLEAGESELLFEFTESDAQLQFNGQGENVLITASYSKDKATVRFDELKAAVNLYADRVLSEAVNLHPGLKANRSLASWYPSVIKVPAG